MKSLLPLVVLLFGLLSNGWAKTIELNVVASGRAPFNATQEWARALARLKSVRVRASGQGSTRPDITQSGDIIRVTGVIDGSNRLVVPGKSFTKSQIATLQSWLDAQRKGEANGTSGGGKNRFGLTKAQLETARVTLKSPLSASTKDQTVDKVVSSISRQIGLPVSITGSLRTALMDVRVPEEWQGFSCGTSIAAALRPLELVMVPRVGRGGKIEMQIVPDQAVKEGWPVGWPSTLKKRELIPKIYDPLPIDISETPIAKIIAAIASRIDTAVFYDWALLDLLEIDPANAKVTHYSKRTIYTKAISLTLAKAQLKHEIRVDERGKPFIWILPRRVPKTRAKP